MEVDAARHTDAPAGHVAFRDVKERARRRLSSLGFSYVRRKASPGTGVSGIVPRVGSGRVGPAFSTPCAWPSGSGRLPSASRQSPHKRSSRFPSRGVDAGYSMRGGAHGDNFCFRSARNGLPHVVAHPNQRLTHRHEACYLGNSNGVTYEPNRQTNAQHLAAGHIESMSVACSQCDLDALVGRVQQRRHGDRQYVR